MAFELLTPLCHRQPLSAQAIGAPGGDSGPGDQRAKSAGPRRAGAPPGPLASSRLAGLFLLYPSPFLGSLPFPSPDPLPHPRVPRLSQGLCFTLCSPTTLLFRGSASLCLSPLVTSSFHQHNASSDPGGAHWLVGQRLWLGYNCPP